MKSTLVILCVTILSACGTAKNVSDSEVMAHGKSSSAKNKTASSLLVCSKPQVSDDGYSVVFDMDGIEPVKVVVNKISRAGTTQIGASSKCSKLDSYDPTLADGAQPQYSCSIVNKASRLLVVLTDGNRAGKRSASVTALFSYGSLPIADKLPCVDASN